MSDPVTAPLTEPQPGGSDESTAKFERAELVRGWHAYEPRKPRVLPYIKAAGKTDMGQVRENNEDKFDFYEPEDPAILDARGCLYAVSDGIGGAQAGQIASEQLLKNLIAGYYDHTSPDLLTALYESIVAANDRIYSLAQMIPERNGMGATLTALVFCEDRVIVAQVGDSRAYCLRGGTLFQITQDHSWVEEQVRAGAMTREDAETSPFKNVITRSVGAAPTVSPDFYEEQSQPGDVWILCSDGLTAYATNDEIAAVAGQFPPSEAARQFIEMANARGGRDNITAFVISVRTICPYEPQAESATPETAPAPAAAPSDEQAPFETHGATGVRSDSSNARPGWKRLLGIT
ncbi:MAG TPA: PP2C family serine/threonine-protein phosphatase [Chthonomonadaceae bacterium]|nr:PP2C family serine/threonine-protein phosphatase [Chthonomonadaceae bacterium]